MLRSLRRDAERDLGAEVRDAVVTAPAYFSQRELDDQRLAVRLAGLRPARILPEPTAACLAHRRLPEGDCRGADFDLGGGTFDVSILDCGKAVFEEPGPDAPCPVESDVEELDLLDGEEPGEPGAGPAPP